MKKNYIFLVLIPFIFTSNLILSQTTETENFDSGSSADIDLTSGVSTPSGFWSGASDYTTNGQFEWEIESGGAGTPSSFATGPPAPYNGNAYMYAETSDDSSGDEFILVSDTFSSTSATMSFYYFMHGSTIGTLYVDESTDSGTSWSNILEITGEQQSNQSDDWIQVTSGAGAFNSISSGVNKLRIRYVSGSSYDGDAAIDQIVVTYNSGPAISVGSAVTGLNYDLGSGPSTSQSTTISGSNLEADITVSAPTNFEISTDNSSFSDSVTLSESSGSVSSTNVHVRLKIGLANGDYSGNITASSTNATNQTVALSGTISTPVNSYGGSNSTTVHSGSTEDYPPMRIWYSYNYSELIYKSSDIGTSGTISGMSLYWDGSASQNRGVVIYMGHTNKDEFTSSSDWFTSTSLTQVFSGDLALTNSAGWVSVTFDSNFTYNGSDNLVIGIDDNDGNYVSGCSECRFRGVDISDNQSLLKYTDASNINAASPGSGTRYSHIPNLKLSFQSLSNVWDGSTDTDWSTAANWSKSSVPTSTDKIIIPNVDNQPVIDSNDGSSGDVTIAELTVDSGAEITISKATSLTITNNYVNNSGTVNLNSDSNEFASIKVGGTSSGNITYNRYVNSVSNGSGWDLIGSPVGGLSINSFATTNDSPLATGGGSGSNQYAIGYYDNSQSSSAAAWTNYTTATIGGAGNFTKGKGYQMATDSGATLAFTGTIDTNATEIISIESFTDASGFRWNLISNPYPSYITLGPNTTTDTFLEVNDDTIDDTYVGVYGYDANTDGDGSGELFDIYNNTSSAKIAPGQAFMVAARSTTAANITFKEEMQTVSGSDDFISGDVMENTEVELRIYNGDNGVGKTRLFFDEGLGMGLDRGWDAGHYYENAAIMTRLVEDDEGHGMAINAMGLDAMENAVIPLVINQSAGQEFRINLFTATIPDPNVYLEDIEEGTFTNLYEEDFVYTPTSDLSGVGRFFIHMSADTMSSGEVSTSMLNAYKEIDASYITIEGLATQTNETIVSLYNILGREVLSTTLNNNMGTQTISTVGLSAGIYVIELESGTDRLTKKLLIQ